MEDLKNTFYRSWLHIGEDAYRCTVGATTSAVPNGDTGVIPGHYTQYGNSRRNGFDPRGVPAFKVGETDFTICLDGKVGSLFAAGKHILIEQNRGWSLVDAAGLTVLSQGTIERATACGALSEQQVFWMDDALEVFDLNGKAAKRVYMLLARKRGFTDVVPVGQKILITGFMSPPYIPDMDEPYVTHEIISLSELGDPDEDSGLCEADRTGIIAFYGNRSIPPVITDKGILVAVNESIVIADLELNPLRQFHIDKEVVGISAAQDGHNIFCLSRTGNRFDLHIIETSGLLEIAAIPDIGFIPVCPVLAGSEGQLIVIGSQQFTVLSADKNDIVTFGAFEGGYPVFASLMLDKLFIASGAYLYMWNCATWERTVFPLPDVATTPVVQAGSGMLVVGTCKGLVRIADKKETNRAGAQ